MFDNHHCRGIVRLANFLTVVERDAQVLSINRRVSIADESLWRWLEHIFFYYKVIREGDFEMFYISFSDFYSDFIQELSNIFARILWK